EELTQTIELFVIFVSLIVNSLPKVYMEGQPITVWSTPSRNPNFERYSDVISPRSPNILDFSNTAFTNCFTSSSKGNPSFNLGSNGALKPTPITTTGIVSFFINLV